MTEPENQIQPSAADLSRQSFREGGRHLQVLVQFDLWSSASHGDNSWPQLDEQIYTRHPIVEGLAYV